MVSPPIYVFDDVTMDVGAMRISRGASELDLEPKSFRLLQCLIENRDRVMGKEEIFRAVWQDAIVSDNALTRAVAQIRKSLDDDPRSPRYIDTIPTVGYRFIGTLSERDVVQPIPISGSRRPIWWKAAWVAASLIIVVLAFIELRHAEQTKQVVPPMSPPIPLTTYRGSEDSPSFSPDGNQVAFEWNGEKQDKFDIYVKTLGSDATPLRLTSDPAPDRYPAWSPDGSTIAFQRFVSDDKVDLMLIPALGGPERKLAEFRPWIDPIGYTITWSSDSKWIIAPVANGAGATLFRVSVETGESSPIVESQQSVGNMYPALSPDGKTLLYTQHPPFNFGSLWTVHVDSELKAIDTPRKITGPDRLFRQAIWTPDGREIIARGMNGIVRMPANGSDDPQLFLAVGIYRRTFGLSPRGNRFAYSLVHGDANIYRIDLTAKVPHSEPVIASTRRDVYPQYSPDGSKISFHTDRSGEALEVWVVDADGKNPRQLTFMKSGISGTAHWSPNGQTISFDSNSAGPFQVYKISSDGGKAQRLTQGDYGNFGSAWSHDGKWIYYTSRATGRNELWKMPSDGGPAIQITHNGSMGEIESPDGKAIYFCKETGSGSIWRMPVDGGPEEQLVDSLYRSNFAATREGIYYIPAPHADGTSELRFYSFSTRSSKLIMPIGVPEYGLDVSPDGRYLVYAQLDEPASDLMLIENFR
jgi:Tol biopolymer transport system component/DNA-binding winged helix-turn-helix (wHTH) protein